MKYYPNTVLTVSCFVVLSTFSCKKENFNESENRRNLFDIYRPYVERTDQSITLLVQNISGVVDYLGTPPPLPNFFEIYFYEEPNNPILVEKVTITEDFSLTFDNLVTGKPYYIQLNAGKEGFEPIIGRRLMTIPEKNPVINFVFPQKDAEFRSLTYSFDNRFYAYNPNQNRGQLFYQKTDVELEQYIATTYGRGHWSPIKNKLVYLSQIKTDDHIYTDGVELLDIETRKTETLFKIDYEQYNVQQLRFTPDGKHLIFMSSEGNENSRGYDIWTYNLARKEKIKHSNFASNNFIISYVSDQFTQSDRLLLSGTIEGASKNLDIYAYDYSQNTLIPIIESEWRDTRPLLSPNGQKIAFVSDRSGGHLWIYDLHNKTYKQITDNQYPRFGGPSTNMVWEEENAIIATAFIQSERTYKPIRILLEQ